MRGGCKRRPGGVTEDPDERKKLSGRAAVAVLAAMAVLFLVVALLSRFLG